MNKLKLLISPLLLFIVLMGNSTHAQSEFAAYYTKLATGQNWEAESRTGKYADLVVRINATSEFVFWRGNSYLPYWTNANGTWDVPEIVPRTGDGSGSMPDRVNSYSHVRLISVNNDSAVVHWRYLPSFSAGNPKVGEDHRNVVDEIFTIYPNGQVRREVRQGDTSYDNWEASSNVTVQSFDLTAMGISNINTTPGTTPGPTGPITGNPVLGPNVVSPVAWWRFDGAQGNAVTESISGYTQTVPGHKTNWKQGVSGTALALDGYNSFLTLPNANSPALGNAFTLEAWVALGATPWTDQGIIHRGNGGAIDGFGLHLDELGEIVGKIIQGNDTTLVFGTPPLPFRQWAHVAMVVDVPNNITKVFINGQEVGNAVLPAGAINNAGGDLHIGSGTADINWFYTLDAVLDEVRIYNVALTNAQVAQSYNNFNPGVAIAENANMDARNVPEGSSSGQFGVRYERLPFYDTWDQLFRDGKYADIVVEYDNSPVKTVFWRGASYSPFHTNGAKGRFNSEFNENFSTDMNGNYECCYEPMSDKQHLYSHARVVENTPARVVVHWRYPQIFPDHTVNHFNTSTGWGDWSDWYMYCYPDGMTAYEMIWWTDSLSYYAEWAEPMLLLGPGEHPDSIVPFTNTVTNYTQTTSTNWNWSLDWNTIDLLHNSGDEPQIQTINITGSNYRPVMVYEDLETWGPYNDYNRYNHWPVGQKPTAGSDDFQAASRTGHTAILKPGPPQSGYQNGNIANGIWKKQLRLEGMSDRDSTSLRRLYRSWKQAPTLSNEVNVSGQYALEQRAFNLTASGQTLSFTVNASTNEPLDNPCFIIKNWCGEAAAVTVNGASAPNGIKQGVFTDTDGTPSLAVYVQLVSSSPTNFEIACDPTANLVEETNKLHVSLWPNPADQEVRIESTDPVLRCSISDVSGKLIKRLDMKGKKSVDVKFLPVGMYFLEVVTSKGKASLKFMKQ